MIVYDGKGERVNRLGPTSEEERGLWSVVIRQMTMERKMELGILAIRKVSYVYLLICLFYLTT